MTGELPPPPLHPVNRELLLDRLDPDKMKIRDTPRLGSGLVDKLVNTGLLRALATDSEWFDFGRVDIDTLMSATEDAKNLLHGGLFILPYSRCVFRMRLTSVHGDDAQPLEVIYLCEQHSTLKLKDGGHPDAVVIPVALAGLRAENVQIADLIIVKDNQLASEREAMDIRLFKSHSKLFLGLWVMLNTRNIAMRVVEPDTRLNRARTKNGRPTLRRVIHVDAEEYVTALRETERTEREPGTKGERKSPRMHLRRAHLRKVSDTHVIAIHAMIINARNGIGLQRSRYERKP